MEYLILTFFIPVRAVSNHSELEKRTQINLTLCLVPTIGLNLLHRMS